ncbi:adenosylcobinamide-phosphate synthase CbiB [Woodsholea maritima]|uniref:adenosylcobinamide-phosphate synthase CbiB n=1 Tax=Woodsholea maritima TaxID=240237 RepID=UPI00036DC78B|nr:adenosylcobinamide-phosphate synthase CbiB [Woodsholea maritima]
MDFAAGFILIALAWLIEAVLGWPAWLYARIKHPVVWIGALIALADKAFNKDPFSHQTRYILGALACLILLALTTGLAVLITWVLHHWAWGVMVEAVIASSLMASRSLYDHVDAVARPLLAGDLAKARQGVAQIVGRDPERLDAAGIASASLESLAENASDGVIAPMFWGVIFGLPGLVAYKTINTLDSMIGHTSARYHAFGGFAARLDDGVNLIPARLTGVLFALAGWSAQALRVMIRDAHRHRSPNAGWPESALAGVLGIRLSGPRAYGEGVRDEPWLNEDAPDPDASHVKQGLTLYVRAMVLGWGMVAGMAVLGGVL